MGPNDAEVVRVATRENGGTIGDVTFSIGNGFEIAVDAEAGSALHGAGTSFETNAFVRDITANDNIASNPSGGVTGNTNTAAWPAQAQTFAYTVASGVLAGRANHICQVLSFLRVGQDTSFQSSPLFILTA
jgi:hypothetical protein